MAYFNGFQGSSFTPFLFLTEIKKAVKGIYLTRIFLSTSGKKKKYKNFKVEYLFMRPEKGSHSCGASLKLGTKVVCSCCGRDFCLECAEDEFCKYHAENLTKEEKNEIKQAHQNRAKNFFLKVLIWTIANLILVLIYIISVTVQGINPKVNRYMLFLMMISVFGFFVWFMWQFFHLVFGNNQIYAEFRDRFGD